MPDAVPLATMEERDEDWRSFRAKLIKSQDAFLNPTAAEEDARSLEGSSSLSDQTCGWAHVLAAPEQGCLLLANPLMFTTSQTYFNKAVILLFGHGAEGSAGVIVNKQTQHVMGEFRGASTLPASYDACPLYLGGDVGPEVGIGLDRRALAHRAPRLDAHSRYALRSFARCCISCTRWKGWITRRVWCLGCTWGASRASGRRWKRAVRVRTMSSC